MCIAECWPNLCFKSNYCNVTKCEMKSMQSPVLCDVVIEADVDVNKLLYQDESSGVVVVVIHVCHLQHIDLYQRHTSQ